MMEKSPDRLALEELARVSRRGAVCEVQHYLYVPDETAAEAVAASVRDHALDATTRLGADGVNWLVLARHLLIPTEDAIGRIRVILEDLAERHGGEYDGWEAKVLNDSASP
jgi:hypothetical protein